MATSCRYCDGSGFFYSEPELGPCGCIAPCLHIAAYYQHAWEQQMSIGSNLLRHGYAQWARGEVADPKINNLYSL